MSMGCTDPGSKSHGSNVLEEAKQSLTPLRSTPAPQFPTSRMQMPVSVQLFSKARSLPTSHVLSQDEDARQPLCWPTEVTISALPGCCPHHLSADEKVSLPWGFPTLLPQPGLCLSESSCTLVSGAVYGLWRITKGKRKKEETPHPFAARRLENLLQQISIPDSVPGLRGLEPACDFKKVDMGKDVG